MEKTKQDYSAHIGADVSAQEAFKGINDVKEWWSEAMEGSSARLNDVFTVRFGAEVYITLKVVEWVPDKKVVWLVTDCNKPWLKNKKEWNGTKIAFDISAEGDSARIGFTHIGLVPEVECYSVCSNAWDQYIKGSLFKLLTKEKGGLNL